ncbi:MAG: PAS domain-containing protein [Planctomycetes bacterium]|nr:PAS domain-containing protein [Planctomycetota bacterium]
MANQGPVCEHSISVDDSTGRKQHTTLSNGHYKALVEAVPDCVIVIDHEGCIVEVNRAAQTTFGYQRAAVKGQRLSGLIVGSTSQGRLDETIQYYPVLVS